MVVGGSVLTSSLQRYLNSTILPRARLYLALKVKPCESEGGGDDRLL